MSVTSILPLSKHYPAYRYPEDHGEHPSVFQPRGRYAEEIFHRHLEEFSPAFQTIDRYAQKIFHRRNGELTQIRLVDENTLSIMRHKVRVMRVISLAALSLGGLVTYFSWPIIDFWPLSVYLDTFLMGIGFIVGVETVCPDSGADLKEYSLHISRLLRTMNAMSCSTLENPENYSREVIVDLRDALILFRKSLLSHFYGSEGDDFLAFQNNLTGLEALVSNEPASFQHNPVVTRAFFQELNDWKRNYLLNSEECGRWDRFGHDMYYFQGRPSIYGRYRAYETLKDIFGLPDWSEPIPLPGRIEPNPNDEYPSGDDQNRDPFLFSDVVKTFQKFYTPGAIRSELLNRANAGLPSVGRFPQVVSVWRESHQTDGSIEEAVDTMLEDNLIL